MNVLASVIVFAFVFVLYVRYLEKTSVFYPAKQLSRSPMDLGLEFDDVQLTTRDDVVVHGWFFKTPAAKSTLLFLHGNAGNIADRLEKIIFFKNIGLNVFIIDYRGYGNSTGKPSEEGMYTDAQAAYEYLTQRKDINAKNIVAYGESLGGVAVIDLAGKVPLAAFIIDSSFTSAQDMAKVIYPFIPSFLVSLKMDSAAKVRDLKMPKLFLHSKTDEIVPFALGWKLYEAAADPKEFVDIDGGHNDGFFASTGKFVSGIKDFLVKYRLL